MLKHVIPAAAIIALTSLQLSAQEMPAPTPEHKVLMQDVGSWKIEGKMLTETGFQKFEGKETVTAIGGFWTVSDYSAEVFGGLKGSSTVGYDPKSKKYVGRWVDSFQSGSTEMKGTYDAKTKTMTYETKSMGMDGKPTTGKIIVKYDSKDSHTFTMMQKDPTGQSDKMMVVMEMKYARASK